MVEILLTCGKRMHDPDTERSYICVSWLSILSLSTILEQCGICFVFRYIEQKVWSNKYTPHIQRLGIANKGLTNITDLWVSL